MPFLIYVLEDMVKVNAGKPVSMKLEHVFLSYDGGRLRFLVLPLVVDNWLFQKEELKQFLQKLLSFFHRLFHIITKTNFFKICCSYFCILFSDCLLYTSSKI